MRSRASSLGCSGSGISLKVPLRAEVSTVADADRQRAARQGGAERHEMAALEVAEHLGLAALHAQQVGGAGHVDVEEGAAHEEVRGFRRDVLGELGEALRGDDAGQPALAAAAHQVGHGAERDFARLVRHLAGGGGREELRLVDHHEHRIPVIALGIEEAAEEGRRAAHLRLGIEAFEVEHHRDPVLAHAGGDALQIALAAGGIDHHMAELVGQRDEIALRVDDGLLDEVALCSRRRRRRCDLPEPELPWTSRRVASSSSRSSRADCPPGAEDATPMSMPDLHQPPSCSYGKIRLGPNTARPQDSAASSISPPQARDGYPQP